MADISASGASSQEMRIQQAADEAVRILEGAQDRLAPADRGYFHTLREATLRAPLHSLLIAFLLGALIARRPRAH
jgi:hypothetical protein